MRSKLTVPSPGVPRSRLFADQEASPLLAIVMVFLLTLLALLLDNAFAPGIRNSSPLWAVGFLLALVARRRSGEHEKEEMGVARRLSWPRAGLFILLHAGIIGVARFGGPALAAAGGETSFLAGGVASLKYVVLAPTLVLLAPADWLRVGRAYRAELIVATGVLLTWQPYRIFATVWPWYSAGLGRFVHAFAGIFVPALGYAPGLFPTFLGTQLNVSIIFACSGLDAVMFFQRLFALMLILDWNRLNKQRLLISYFAGLTAMIAVNALRITFLVVFGNRVSAGLVERYHIDAGWAFFALAFILYLTSSYSWLLRGSVQVGASSAWGHPQLRDAL